MGVAASPAHDSLPGVTRAFSGSLGSIRDSPKPRSCSLSPFQPVVQILIHASHKAQQGPAHVCQFSGNKSISQCQLASVKPGGESLATDLGAKSDLQDLQFGNSSAKTCH